MNISVLEIATLGDDLNFDKLSSLGNVSVYDITPQDKVVERIADADVVIINKVKLNEDNLSKAKNLKLVCITATGYDNIDTEYCRRNKIAVCNVEGYSTDSVVQLTVAMVLSLVSKLSVYDKYVKSGSYSKNNLFTNFTPVFNEISGKVWGIVGLGNIGKKVAAIAKAMGCKVIVHKRTAVEGYECVDMDTLCGESDIITLHTPLNQDTYHLVDNRRLSIMKKDVILVNVARGPVVDEEAIAQAVLNGDIGGFATDVYSSEPIKTDSPYSKLFDMGNVIFTPHMAWGTKEARQRCFDEVIKNIESFVSGGARSRVV